ncbi:selenocysteine lyase, partial [Candidatus Falkowbacteria bacterium CG_4_8_14_3_um_filter_36_11]
KFEAGLQNYAGIIGLGEAIKYLGKIGFKNIAQQEYELNKYLTEELLDIPNLSIIGPLDPKLRSGIISFNIKGVDPHKIAIMLDAAANIMIRSGQHCVHSWFKSRNIIGSARISLYFYNTREEAKIFVSNLKNILKVI